MLSCLRTFSVNRAEIYTCTCLKANWLPHSNLKMKRKCDRSVEIIIIIYLTYHMFLRKKLKSIKLTKPINILLRNDIKLFNTDYFLLSTVPPVQVASFGEAYESCRQLPLWIFRLTYLLHCWVVNKGPRSRSTLWWRTKLSINRHMFTPSAWHVYGSLTVGANYCSRAVKNIDDKLQLLCS